MTSLGDMTRATKIVQLVAVSVEDYFHRMVEILAVKQDSEKLQT